MMVYLSLNIGLLNKDEFFKSFKWIIYTIVNFIIIKYMIVEGVLTSFMTPVM